MAETCPSCGVGKMMPEKFSNFYMCDFCGNRVYHWSGSRGGSGSNMSDFNDSIEQCYASIREMERAADEVKRSSREYINASHRASAARRKAAPKKKKFSLFETVLWAIFFLFLYWCFFQ